MNLLPRGEQAEVPALAGSDYPLSLPFPYTKAFRMVWFRPFQPFRASLLLLRFGLIAPHFGQTP